jgi:hypothetical protein
MADRPKRKNIPDKIRLEVVLMQDGRCPHCKERLGPLSGLNFDHRPAIINREVNEAGTDYIPPQLDPEYIQAIHEIPCHRERTIGPGGERRTTVAGSDIHIRDKIKRLERKRKESEARQAAAAEIIEPNPEITEAPVIAKFGKSVSLKSKRPIQSANRWPPKKPKTPYRRRGV